MLSELILHPTLPFPQGFLPPASAQAPEMQTSLCHHPWVPLAHVSSQLMEALYFLMGDGGVLFDLEWAIFKKPIIHIIFHVAL